jgi:hypothetical protein
MSTIIVSPVVIVDTSSTNPVIVDETPAVGVAISVAVV